MRSPPTRFRRRWVRGCRPRRRSGRSSTATCCRAISTSCIRRSASTTPRSSSARTPTKARLFAQPANDAGAFETAGPRRLRRARRRDPRRVSARDRRGRRRSRRKTSSASRRSRGTRGRGRCCSRERGKGKAFVYYFDHRTPQYAERRQPRFGDRLRVQDARRPRERPARSAAAPRPEDFKISDLMSSYWVNFAKTGDPNGSGLPAWPAFSPSAQNAMIFDTNARSAAAAEHDADQSVRRLLQVAP